MQSIKKICEIDISSFNSTDFKYLTLLKRSSLIKFLINNIPPHKIKNNLEVKKQIKYGDKLRLTLSDNSSENLIF